jgi:hypothetical protein
MALHFNSQLGCANNSRSDLVLSIVVTTSNSAPSDQLVRLRNQMENIDHFTKKYKMVRSVEYIIVEYNYDADKPSLYSMLHFTNKMVLVRIIRVSAAQHALAVQKMGIDFKVNFLEFYAKNVGIRRACSPFVLPTNSDIVFSEGFWYWLKHTQLQPDSYYRAPRCNCNVRDLAHLQTLDAESKLKDIQAGLIECWWCANPGVQWDIYLKKDFTAMVTAMDVNTSSPRAQYVVCIQAPGDFLILSKQAFFRFRGYPDVALPHQLDDVPVWQATADGLYLVMLPAPAVVFHVNHDKQYTREDGRWASSAEMAHTYKLDSISAHAIEMRKLEVFNDNSWGLAETMLEENIY